MFEFLEIGKESLPAVRAQPAKRLRPAVFKPFPDLDEPSLSEHVEVTAQVAVGEWTEAL
jgi:hypothetical protein